MSNCNQNCEGCNVSNCGERKIQKEKLNAQSSVKKVYAIMSGKGGVGKSSVTSLLACALNKEGYRIGILDADITGPSIPKMFGITELAYGDGEIIYPAYSYRGVTIMSANMMLEEETEPILWRGPIIAGLVKQFWSNVLWKDIDILFVDMPPGTGDVPLTVFQSLPVDGIIVVTSPQELVSMIVEKALNMAKAMNVPIVGLIENYSYFLCPDNGKKYAIFGDSHIDEVCEKHGLSVLAKLPIDPSIAAACDEGNVESLHVIELEEALPSLR